MPVLDEFGFKIDNKYVVGIDTNTLVTHNDAFVFSAILLLFKNVHVTIADIQFVGPLNEVVCFLTRFVNIYLQQVIP
jgi:hypothetical protein